MTKILNIKRVGVCMAIVTVVAIGVFATSCVRRELSSGPGHVEFYFDWSKLSTDQTKPTAMELFFYNESGVLVGSTISNNSVVKTTLPIGKYKILVNKHDIVNGIMCESIESYYEAYAYSITDELEDYRETKGDYSDALWIQEPAKWFYSANVSELNVIKGDTIKQVLTPKSLVNRINLSVSLKGETSSVTEMKGALTGLSPQVLLASELRRGDASNIIFKSQKFENNIFTASALAFGVQRITDDGSKPENTILIGVYFDNGGYQLLDVDISKELDKILPGGDNDIGSNTEISITVGVDVELSSTSETGFTARVTEWTVVIDRVIIDNIDQLL